MCKERLNVTRAGMELKICKHNTAYFGVWRLSHAHATQAQMCSRGVVNFIL